MNIVTLTTDFGDKDHYVGMLKGRILSQGIPIIFADICHHIEPYNIMQAAFTLKNVYKSFPEETIHVVTVNNYYAEAYRFLAVKHKGHYFLGPDNGLFSLLFGRDLSHAYQLPVAWDKDDAPEVSAHFAKAIKHIIQEQGVEKIGQKVSNILQRLSLQPILSKNQIKGSVIHIDNYKNVILNISRCLFLRGQKGRQFEIYFKRFDSIKQISQQYSDVPTGEVLCMFNSADFLEIAVNMGKAATLFGLNIDDGVQINFF